MSDINQCPDFRIAPFQELFDYIVENLIRQGMPSIGEEGCMYRGPEGRKCAIGWVMPDEYYSSYMENQGIVTLACSLNLDSDRYNLLSMLQNAHDNRCRSNWLDAFKADAKLIANKFGLNDEKVI